MTTLPDSLKGVVHFNRAGVATASRAFLAATRKAGENAAQLLRDDGRARPVRHVREPPFLVTWVMEGLRFNMEFHRLRLASHLFPNAPAVATASVRSNTTARPTPLAPFPTLNYHCLLPRLSDNAAKMTRWCLDWCSGSPFPYDLTGATIANDVLTLWDRDAKEANTAWQTVLNAIESRDLFRMINESLDADAGA